MAQFSLLLIGFLVLSGVSAFSTDAEFDNFMLYTHKFNKTYAGFEEFSIRFENFKQSLVRIAERNARSVSATYGLTRFSDMSPEEFRSTMLRARPPAPTDPSHIAAVERAVARQVNQQVNDLPKTVDWRDKNAITYVKDQGQCGSCWAFATTEEVETYWFMAGHQLTDLSPQQIVSCDKVDQGCDGGDPATAYQYVAQYGLQTDDAYPYFSGDDGFTGDCEANYSAVVAHIKSFEYAVPPCNDTCTHQDEDAMAAVVANTGPLSVLVDAESWQDYQFGIIGGDCPSDASSLDHAVQLVGYDFSDSSMPFWIVRNSWSEDWGNMGYVYIAKGGNYCGIADGASYPVV